MEYRIEADGESFCDPHNPLRAPGAFGDKSVVEFPGYEPPAWLDAPDPEPARPIAERVALWSPPDTDPRQPLPLLVAHDGGELRAPVRSSPASSPTRSRPRRLPACRVALLDSPSTATRPTPPRPATRAAGRTPAPARPGDRDAGLGASLGALALLHARWLHPGAFGALMLQSGSYFRRRWDRQESGFPRFSRISRFVGRCCAPARPRRRSRSRSRAARPRRTSPTTARSRTRCAARATRSTLHVNRDGHNYVGWRDTLDPHLVELLARAWG